MKYILLILLSLLLTNCSQHKSSETLFDELGGMTTAKAIADNLSRRVEANNEINFLFEKVDKDDLRASVADFICMKSGGPCTYNGRNMEEVHSGLDIKYHEFDQFIQEFIGAMEEANIPFKSQNKVLKLFAYMREDITKK